MLTVVHFIRIIMINMICLKIRGPAVEEIRDFIHDEKLNGAVKLSTDNIHQIMTVLIEMIEKDIAFYQLMFRMGKDSNIHENFMI